tara:strand:- start:51 stop:632 length:582 start_codon:yes stop_codon:yes gene_type:complete
VNLDLFIVCFYSYILGSIPFGLIITKLFLKEDIRDIGSGNIGATNVLRTGKKHLALLTLILDLIKGYFSIYISFVYFSDLIYFSAIICLLGHIFPAWLKFKGGKGIATYLGIILALSINLGIVFSVTWLLILFIFKYSSLSSIVSTLVVLLYSISFNNLSLTFYLFTVFIIIIFTHKENIVRLKNKSENKIKF